MKKKLVRRKEKKEGANEMKTERYGRRKIERKEEKHLREKRRESKFMINREEESKGGKMKLTTERGVKTMTEKIEKERKEGRELE